MMKKQIAGLVLAVSVVGGVGAGVLANALTSNEPAAASSGNRDDAGADSTPATPTPSRSASASTPTSSSQPTPGGTPSAKPTKAADFVIAPGQVGPVKAGMSKAEAAATGLFDVDSPPAVDGCPVVPLAWKSPYNKVLDVFTVGNGEVTSIGVRAKGPTTAAGIGVGSTYGQLRKAVKDVTPVEAGYGQTGVLEYDGVTGRWVGYLIDTQVANIKDSDRVTFIEVTKGGQPGLMRDGC